MHGPLTADERARIDALVSARVGVIRRLSRWRSIDEEPTEPVFHVAELADAHLLGRGAEASVANGIMGVGKGWTTADAVRRAVGEAVERYCATHPDPGAMVLATEAVARTRGEAIAPPECVLYDEAQYATGEIRYPRYDPAQPLHWVTGHRLDGGEVVVPASLTYLCLAGELAAETWCYTTSNGCAAGPDTATARLGGLHELIERDAFLVTWSHRLPRARLALDGLDPRVQTVARHYADRGIELSLFDLTSDIAVPVVLALAVDHGGRGPAAVIGLGCDLDPATAAEKAVLELCQGHMGETWRHRHDPGARAVTRPEQVTGIRDHASLFASPAALGELDFLLDVRDEVTVTDLPAPATGAVADDLAAAVALVEAAGSRVAFVDVTTPDITSVGLTVVRTFATELQPIHFGHRCERLGGRRLFDVPRRLGFGTTVRTHEQLNRYPHPLP